MVDDYCLKCKEELGLQQLAVDREEYIKGYIVGLLEFNYRPDKKELMSIVMRHLKGRANPKVVKEIIDEQGR